MKSFAMGLALAAGSLHALGADTVGSGFLGLPIPDDSNTGLTLSLDLPASFTLENVAVTLSLSVPEGDSGWFGDLYAYLQHDGEIAVLLNRPGRDDLNFAGYPDSQNALVTFDDTAPNGDIHTYRLALFGDETVSLSEPLGGRWQPDGRDTDPGLALTSDPRNAMLDVFNGQDAAGTWRLFVADLSSGGQYQLDQWSLEITGAAAVPEPAHAALAAALLLAGWTWFRRR